MRPPRSELPAAMSVLPADAFVFLDPGPLVDNELELVAPASWWIDDLLAAANHPLSLASSDPEIPPVTRGQLESFLTTCPGGRQSPHMSCGGSPTYHFWMRLRPGFRPPVPMAGTISLRVGHSRDLEMYLGHIGYGVYPPARGHHYAERSCRLLLPLAAAHGLDPLWITTDPANLASRRTCERLGAVLVETVDVPSNHLLYARGQYRKCRYRLDLSRLRPAASFA